MGFLLSGFPVPRIVPRQHTKHTLTNYLNKLLVGTEVIHRKGTPGFSQDARRAFVQNEGVQERQFMFNSAYDALTDLCPTYWMFRPKAISLEGLLGLAFGSHGSAVHQF